MIVVLGDTLQCLGALQFDPAALLLTDTAGRYTDAAVIGLNATSATTRRAFKTAMRRQAQASVAVCKHWTTLRHIMVIVDAAASLADEEVLDQCDIAAEATHRMIEQICGIYVVITYIVVTGCDDPRLLAHRVRCRADQIPATDAYSAVHWREIAQSSIQHVTADRYL
ncbi:hypothetical protein E3T61_14150 [Cryobacterium lactosi]|uniref:Uncharacterized protein n=1 Tax=Cryobacterium lactosi TaxID=1259202 RepID=A0A4R9BM45_9MICO|nr:hypothetical protein [Cryobacterium lactosi]TFD87006.1 hypothetical protein E3T61_14150 [Cryobacterium lactosi]